MKILVVDDDALMREIMGKALASAGNEVILCVDGEEALREIVQSKFDLIVTDIVMPKMDGIALMYYIQKESMAAATPIMAVSGGGKTLSSKDTLSYASYYADFTLKKPFTQDNFLACIESLTYATHVLKRQGSYGRP